MHSARTEAADILKSETVKFAIACKVAFTLCPKTLADASQVVHYARTGLPGEVHDAMDHLYNKMTIGRHALILDDAIDLLISDLIAKSLNSRFFGFSFATDESPPQSNRFDGLRFQITYAYH